MNDFPRFPWCIWLFEAAMCALLTLLDLSAPPTGDPNLPPRTPLGAGYSWGLAVAILGAIHWWRLNQRWTKALHGLTPSTEEEEDA